MRAEKLSISIPASSLEFIEKYRKKHDLKSRSHVIETAIAMLRERELEAAYRAAAREPDAAYDIADSDGLPDEAW
jgi:Arc/MetJ-type ribon-helix-helix transcriptional regulator